MIVLVDSSAFVATASTRDQNRGAARRVGVRANAEGWTLVSTNFILAETHALALSRHGPVFATRLLLALDRGGALVVRIGEDDERRAREILVRYDDKAFSLTDATSFAVMDRLGITDAFTFDRHFTHYGFSLVEPNVR